MTTSVRFTTKFITINVKFTTKFMTSSVKFMTINALYKYIYDS